MTHRDCSKIFTAAIILAREDENTFNRCTFPIMGRPIVTYPALAAANSRHADKCYLSTSSKRIITEVSGINNIEIIYRENECENFLLELKRTLEKIKAEAGRLPDETVLLLGNSPCVLSGTVDSAVDILHSKPEIDSVVTAEKRNEFNVSNAFKMNQDGTIRPSGISAEYDYFINHRVIAFKTERIIEKLDSSDDINILYGNKVFPLIETGGIADIDYSWQVPQAERWLKDNGFTGKDTPYKNSGPEFSGKSSSLLSEISVKERKKWKIFVSTVPFGSIDPYPVNILENEPSVEFLLNPLGRKLKEEDHLELLKDIDILIAGTEPLTPRVMDAAKKLKLISRVGIGLDSVDLLYAREKGIAVSYTPDAPAPAVAELTIGHMLNLCRYIPLVDRRLRDGVWQRVMGLRLAEQTIGIIGTGRVGSRVLRHIQGFAPEKILVNDIKPDSHLYDLYHAEHVSRERIYAEADIITLHVPLTPITLNLITSRELEAMKDSAFLLNTARGGIVNEKDLYEALRDKKIAGAAVDVFENEPYAGELTTLDNCYMTCHMGSCSLDCRFGMEKLAAEEALRFVKGEELQLSVPEYEYELKRGI